MDTKIEFSSQAFSKIVMHAMKFPHCACSGFLLSPKQPIASIEDKSAEDPNEVLINEAIPVSHASQCLSSNVEIAYNAICAYAEDQDLVISGYYQTDRFNESSVPDIFSQRIAEKIVEQFKNAVLCLVNFEETLTQSILDPYQFIDGKWRRKAWSTFKIENDVNVIADNILYTKENLYRKIVDFDEHFNNISLDWTNLKISQRIDTIIADVC